MNTQQQQDLARFLELDEQRTQGEWLYDQSLYDDYINGEHIQKRGGLLVTSEDVDTNICEVLETKKPTYKERYSGDFNPSKQAWINAEYIASGPRMAALLRVLSAENAALRAVQGTALELLNDAACYVNALQASPIVYEAIMEFILEVEAAPAQATEKITMTKSNLLSYIVQYTDRNDEVKKVTVQAKSEQEAEEIWAGAYQFGGEEIIFIDLKEQPNDK